MQIPILKFLQHLILSLKSGRSVHHAEKTFQEKHLALWLKLHSSKKEKASIPIESVEYELLFILERGKQGLPILSSLICLHSRAFQKVLTQVDEHSAKAPFLALLPLFLFQMPSLMLIFIYPITAEFLEAFK